MTHVNSSVSLRGLSSRFACAAAAVALYIAAPLPAQEAESTIKGTIIDATTGKYLEAADIALDNGNQHTTSERDGIFEFRNVAPGAHTLTIAYPGFAPITLPATATAGQVTTVPVRLNDSVVKLSEYKVSGAKEGMSEAIALRKAAPNMKVVAASDQYGDIAEGNAAEYLKFLPGVGVDYNANDARAVTLRGMNTQFTNVTMNGNPIASATSGNLMRRFEFEQAPINNVETIEVVKTLTPELQASGTGGLVNFVSKSAFDREGSLFTYRLYFQAINDDLYFNKTEGWGQEKTRKILPGADLDYSLRISKNLGVSISYKNSQLFNDYPRSQYNWEYNPANGGTPTNPILVSFSLQNEQKDTRRQALSSQVDYRLGDGTTFSFLASWAFYDLIFTDRVVTVTPGAALPLATTSTPYTGSSFTGLAGKGNVALQTINRWKSGVTWDFPFSVYHDFANGSRLDATAYWSQAYSKYRDTTGGWYSDMTITRGGTNPSTNTVTDPLTVSFANIGGVVPSYTVYDSTGAVVDLRDDSKYVVTQIRSRPQTGVDTKDGYNADYKINLPTTLPIAIKVGGRVDDTTRNISNPIYNRTGVTAATGFLGNAITGSQLVSLEDTGFSNHPIGYGLPAYNFVSLYSAYTALGGNSILPYTPASDIQARFEDTTDAGYVRFDITPLKDLLIVGGVRYEDRKTLSINRLTTLPAPVSDTFQDKSWFPSVNLKYTVQKLVLRASYAKSIGLPDYSDLLPGPLTITDPTSSARGKVSVYNPGLKAYKIDNYDAGVEYYFNTATFVSASVFRKTLTNYIVTVTQGLDANYIAALGIPSTAFGAPVDQYDVTTKYNVKDPGHYNGVELGYAQNFSFLPKPFNTIGLQINTTLLSIDPIKSNAVFSSTDANLNRAILDQINKSLALASVKQALNVALSYSIGNFAFNVESNYTGYVLKLVTQKTVKYSDAAVNQYFNELQYQAPRETVDFASTILGTAALRRISKRATSSVGRL